MVAVGAALRRFGARLKPTRKFLNQDIIFAVHAGGLGDHLAYSALPRLYKRAGARRVRLSAHTNAGEPLTRNQGIMDLVWGPNPYLDGVTDDLPNVGEEGWPPMAFFRQAKGSVSPIETVARIHGLPITDRKNDRHALLRRPDLFYRPKHISRFSEMAVCDPRSISQPFTAESFEMFVDFLERWYGVRKREVVVLESGNSGANGNETLAGNPRHAVRDIFEYADIIHSAQHFLVTESGGQSLAAAVRSKPTFVLITSRSYNESLFLWPGNTYFVTSEMTRGSAEWP